MVEIAMIFAMMHFASADKDLEGVPARLDLDKLLRGLKPMQRRVLEMAYVEDMPDQEIAEILGTTLACVKNSIHHAKRRVGNISEKITVLGSSANLYW